MPKPSEVLQHALHLVTRGHVKGVFAADKTGKAVKFVSSAATCFCAAGALHRSLSELNAAELNTEVFHILRTQIPVSSGEVSISSYNDLDSTTQSDVIDWFKRAIEDALSKGN